MKIKFEYNHNTEYVLRTESNIHISGEGEWDVNSTELAEEFVTYEDYDFLEFLNEYFYLELGINPSFVKFDVDDISELENICTQIRENYESSNKSTNIVE